METTSWWQRVAIHGVVAFHFVAFFAWSLPSNTLIKGSVVHWVTPYLSWSGLWQGWDMFSPNPSSVCAHLTAQVRFDNNEVVTWNFPRIRDMGFVDKYFNERYRKWAIDRVRTDDHSGVWPDAARFVVRQVYDGHRRPVEVTLTRHWEEVKPPTGSGPWPALDHTGHSHSYTFYTYQVSAEDLL